MPVIIFLNATITAPYRYKSTHLIDFFAVSIFPLSSAYSYILYSPSFHFLLSGMVCDFGNHSISFIASPSVLLKYCYGFAQGGQGDQGLSRGIQNLRMREEPECIRKWKVMRATWFRFRFQVPIGHLGLFLILCLHQFPYLTKSPLGDLKKTYLLKLLSFSLFFFLSWRTSMLQEIISRWNIWLFETLRFLIFSLFGGLFKVFLDLRL